MSSSSVKLNAEQEQAANHYTGACLVTAVPGSGKTATLTQRVVRLLARGEDPRSICCITFTNKAANEMKERIQAQDPAAKKVWVSTFHRFCVKLLRSYGDKVGLQDGFSIYDDDDCKGLMMKAHRLWCAERESEEPLSSQDRYALMALAGDLRESTKPFSLDNEDVRIKTYINELRNANAVDFSGMLYLSYRILTKCPEIAEKLSSRFKFVMVDEAQDTNDIQYAIAKILASHGNLFMVGDYQQSIFSWRGAKPENLMNFQKDFPEALILELPRNYRSRAEILARAERVIQQNETGAGVQLLAERGEGGRVDLAPFEREWDESAEVAWKMHKLHDAGMPWGDMAIIFRLNKQAQPFEVALAQNGIPYRTRGGPSFFARKEIKTALAYMRLLGNPSDSTAFAQAIGSPKRGVGDVLIGKIELMAQEKGISVLEAAGRVKANKTQRSQLDDFAILLEKGRNGLKDGTPIADVVHGLVYESGYMGQLKNEADDEKDGPKSLQRMENVDTFIEGIGEFEAVNSKPTMDKFLQQVALVQEGDKDKDRDAVNLMSMHSAKGLEFPAVFVVGVAEGVVPHSLSCDEGRTDEERRLFYVALTRAKDYLHVSWHTDIMKWGRSQNLKPSRFIGEMFDEDELYDILG